MKQLYRFVLLWVLLLLAAGPVAAQNIVYYCDFEQPAERSQWVKNPVFAPVKVSDLYNRWYIGKPGSFDANGQYGLYISSEADSAHAVYSAPGEGYTIAYRSINGLQANIAYTLQLDYRIQGSATNANCQVWWVPNSYPYLDSYNGVVDLADWTANGAKQIGSVMSLNPYWATFQASFTLTATQVQGRLVFLWKCNSSNPTPPSACIDNIKILDAAPCGAAPAGVKYDSKTGKLSWLGNRNDQFEVTFYNTFTETFETRDTITGVSCQYNVTGEGYYIAYVRRLCADSIATPWGTTGSFIWSPGVRCVELFDLGPLNQNAGKCFVGKHVSSSSGHTFTWQPGFVDNGYADPSSMHTIHYDRTETDSHSDGKLYTVPPGEVASVRIGAYTGDGEDARIEYKYTVTPGQSDLLYLKYACVLQSGGHEDDNPFFQLDILDEYGHQIEGCTHEYFVADMTGTDGKWHQIGDIYWSEWDEVAVSLRNYRNSTLTIRLTASRCVFDTHFGYAYFTISCASGDLEGIHCGDFGTTEFEAPEGFDYKWYWEGDSLRENLLCEDRVYVCGPQTDSIFMVDVISKSQSAGAERCSFTLTANPNPRLPRAGGMYTLESIGDCSSHVVFTDTSYVVYVNRKDPTIITRSETEFPDVTYYFSDGTQAVVKNHTCTHAFPPIGGVDTIKVVATMSQGECGDTAYILVELPELRSRGRYQVIDRCDGDPYPLPTGEVVTSDTVYYALHLNEYQCEYYDTLDIRFHDTFRDTTYQAICEGTKFTFEGKEFSTEGLDSVNVATETGCDSVRYLNLHIIPDVRFAMEPLNSLAPFCDDQPSFAIPVTVNTGKYAGAALVPDARAVAAGFKPRYEYPMEEPYSELAQPLDTVYEIPVDTFIRPGYYTFQLQSLYRECPVDAVPFNFTLYYSSKALYQKDGYIVLYNPEYNYADYEFSSYRWFRDGVLLPDTKSYIQPTDSDYQHIYQIELIPAGDSIGVMSCPLVYTGQFTPHRPIQNIRSSVSPSVVRTGEPLYVTGEGDARIYDALGRLVMSAPVDSENPVSIPAPQRGGMYVVLIQNDAYRVLVH